MMHGLDGYGWGGGYGMILMWIVPILVIGLIVWLVVEATRTKDNSRNRQVGQVAEPRDRMSGRGLEILDERYARGEMDREEYLERRRDLER